MMKAVGSALLAGTMVMGCCAKDLNVLMIGNSFSICVGKNLPKIVKSVPGHHLKLTSAYIGGCSLERHWSNIVEAEKDAQFKPYSVDLWDSSKPVSKQSFKGNVNELLKNNRYDIVTIQQASHASWNYETYQPFANDLIAFIRKHNPNAEIIVQQTWAYRSDDGRIHPEKHSWEFDQQGMHDRLTAAYTRLAKENNFRMIPMGEAVRLTRELDPVRYAPPTAAEAKALQWPDLPKQAGDVVGKNWWQKNKKSGEMTLAADTIHLNERGEYLQACVWFAYLFGEPTTKIAYDHPQIGKSYSQFLRDCAQKAVDAAGK